MSPIALSGLALQAMDPLLLERAVAALPRLVAADSSLWGQEAQPEAATRLGWLTLPTTSRTLLEPLDDLAD